MKITIPGAVALFAATLCEWAATRVSHRRPVATAEGVRLALRSGPLDVSKARRELGYAPRPVRQALADFVAWFMAQDARPALARSDLEREMAVLEVPDRGVREHADRPVRVHPVGILEVVDAHPQLDSPPLEVELETFVGLGAARGTQQNGSGRQQRKRLRSHGHPFRCVTAPARDGRTDPGRAPRIRTAP
jgi:hypothetical protein